eukprot:5354452-Prymnesium_polylepis.2
MRMRQPPEKAEVGQSFCSSRNCHNEGARADGRRRRVRREAGRAWRLTALAASRGALRDRTARSQSHVHTRRGACLQAGEDGGGARLCRVGANVIELIVHVAQTPSNLPVLVERVLRHGARRGAQRWARNACVHVARLCTWRARSSRRPMAARRRAFVDARDARRAARRGCVGGSSLAARDSAAPEGQAARDAQLCGRAVAHLDGEVAVLVDLLKDGARATLELDARALLEVAAVECLQLGLLDVLDSTLLESLLQLFRLSQQFRPLGVGAQHHLQRADLVGRLHLLLDQQDVHVGRRPRLDLLVAASPQRRHQRGLAAAVWTCAPAGRMTSAGIRPRRVAVVQGEHLTRGSRPPSRGRRSHGASREGSRR